MFEVIISNIKKKVAINDEEAGLLKTFFTPKKLRKKQYLLQEGDVSHYTAFVEKGVLRSFTIDDKGHEHIMQFATEDWWISDLYSFLTEEPSDYSIEALEETELLLINKEHYENMMLAVPKMERYFRILTQNSLISMQRRISGKMTLTAEQNYKKLMEQRPALLQRVPQHMIASFLGIAPETLSRIRKQMASSK
jgi:CRP-like cAMP-binding protein